MSIHPPLPVLDLQSAASETPFPPPTPESRAGYHNRISRAVAFANRVVWNGKTPKCIQITVYFRQNQVVDGFAIKGWVHLAGDKPGSAGTWLTYNYQNPGRWEEMSTGQSLESNLVPLRKNTASVVMAFVPFEEDFSKIKTVDFWIQSWFNRQHEMVDGWYFNDRHIWYPNDVSYP